MNFAYAAIPVQGGAALVRGQEDAPDERRLRSDLRARGLIAVEVRPVRVGDVLRARLSQDRLRARDAAWFFATLKVLLAGHVPIEAALTDMVQIAPTARARAAAEQVRERIRSGATLADGAEAVPGLVSPQHAALLRAGHESGRLAHAVELVDRSIASGARIRRSLVNKLIYPAILLCAALGAVWFLSSFVIPKFAETLASMDRELPAPTRLTLAAARAVTWLAPLIIVLGIAAAAMRSFWLTPALRLRLSALALRLPVVGPLIWNSQAAIFCDMMATMIDGGGDLLSAMNQSREVVSSPEIARRVDAARRALREGGDLGAALRDHQVLPPMVGTIVAVGVRGGSLVPALRQGCETASQAQQNTTDRLLMLLEPAIILFLALSVGWLVYSLVSGILAVNELGSA